MLFAFWYMTYDRPQKCYVAHRTHKEAYDKFEKWCKFMAQNFGMVDYQSYDPRSNDCIGLCYNKPGEMSQRMKGWIKWQK